MLKNICVYLGDRTRLLLPSNGNSIHCICQNRLVKYFTGHFKKSSHTLPPINLRFENPETSLKQWPLKLTDFKP